MRKIMGYVKHTSSIQLLRKEMKKGKGSGSKGNTFVDEVFNLW